MPKLILRDYMRIIALLLLAWAFLLIGINDTWTGHNSAAGTWLSASIHHWKEQGLATFNYLPVYNDNLGPTDPETANYYVHHPPLMVWGVGLMANFIGFDEFPSQLAIRFLPISATLFSICAYYVLVRRLLGHSLAYLAMGLYAFTPMVLYYGRMPGYEQIIPALVLLYTAVFINWLRQPTHTRTIFLGILAVLSMWTAWVAVFYLAALGVVTLVYGSHRQRLQMILIGAITVFATLLIPVMYEMLHPGTIQDMIDVFKFRVSNREAGPASDPISLVAFIENILEHTLMFLSFGVVILGVYGLRLLPGRGSFVLRIALALLVVPFAYLLAFRNAFFFHDYYKTHFLPVLALSATLTIQSGWNARRRGRERFAKPLVLSIMLCSYIVAAGWLLLLHQSNDNPFSAQLIQELPQYTQAEDRILSNSQRPYLDVSYHAYRNIEWGILIEEVEDWVSESPRDAFYLLCLSAETVEIYDGTFSDWPYELLGGECRLIDLSWHGEDQGGE